MKKNQKQKIIEFGSNYHIQKSIKSLDIKWPKNPVFYGSAREAIFALLKYNFEKNKWKRIWIPNYYCDSVIKKIITIGIELVFYNDNPDSNDIHKIDGINFQKQDVLLRVNYFGLRKHRDNSKIRISVIEDHSHAFFSDWANNSNADWCFSSIRKELPIADGGVLWSPKGIVNEFQPEENLLHQHIVNDRYQAMLIKKQYLEARSLKSQKVKFLELFEKTEEKIGIYSETSKMSEDTFEYLNNVPENWIKQKASNYKILQTINLPSNVEVIKAEEGVIPFSFLLSFKNQEDRGVVRSELINNNIYPAILWPQNEWMDKEGEIFSSRMLSIHCDGRYSQSEIELLKECLEKLMSNLGS